MERYTETYIQGLLSNLKKSIDYKDEINSIIFLEQLMTLKPACKIKVVNQTNSSVHHQILNYVNSMDSNVSLKHIPGQQNVSLPQNMAEKTLMNSISSGAESSGMNAKSIDSFNKEVYDKLFAAGNSRDDARYGATGVSSMQEAMAKLKNRKK